MDIDLSPQTVNLKWLQGTDIEDTLLYFEYVRGGSSVDLSGYTAEAAFSYKQTETPVFMLTTADQSIVLNETAGKIEMVISVANQAELTKTRGVWDFWLFAQNGQRKPLMVGEWEIDRAIPRE